MRNLIILAAVALSLNTGATAVMANDECRMVQSWYGAYLGRPADPEGLQNWLCWLRRGMPPLRVQAHLLGSDEYYHRNGCTPRGFVAGMYRDILGRAATCHEIEQWVCHIGACGRVGLAERFLCAAQHELRLQTVPPVPPAEFPPPGLGRGAPGEPFIPAGLARRLPPRW